MKHVIITGGAGFIGHNLAKLYLDEGFSVSIVDNLSTHYKHAALTKYRLEHLDNKRAHLINASCSSKFRIKENIKSNMQARSIIHLASFPNQAAVAQDTYSAISTMTMNTYALASLAKELGIRFINVSSSMVYGNFTSNKQEENSNLNPTNLYGTLKKQCEEIAKFENPNTINIRPSAVYGPGDNQDRVINKWILSALENHPIEIDNPSSLLDFTHVNDLVKGIKQIEEEGQSGETYNVTFGQARSLGETALLIKHLMHDCKSELIYHKTADLNMPQRGALDITKATNLGYRPKIDLVQGLTSQIHWIENYRHVY